METYLGLYSQIYDFENLYNAYLEAREDKRFRDEILDFTANLEENLLDIQNHLIYQTYEVGRYREKIVYEPKKRLIMILPFRDRVVQCAIYRIINPIFAKSYIDTSYGSIKGKGPLNAAKKLQYWLRLIENEPEAYQVLKMDIAKFFFRVPHDLLLVALGSKIKDQQVMWLFNEIINCTETPFGLPLEVIDPENCPRLFDIGMPAGSLVSQMLANIILNPLDQYIKRELHVKFYMRLMDDMLVLSPIKQELHEIKKLVRDYLEQNIQLALNNKTSIRPVTLGIEFCGYKVWSTHFKLRKSTTLRMKRRLKIVQKRYADGKIELDGALSVVNSYQGLMKHCDSFNLRCAIFGDRDRDIPGWFSLKRNTPEATAVE